MFTKFYRCPSCKMTLEAHIITSIRNARPLAERSLRHVHSGSSVHLSSKQYSAVWVVPSLQSLQIHRPVTRRERESQYRAPKPYKESRCRLVKPSPSDQQGLQCIPTSGWHSTKRQASRRPSFMPYRNPICRLSGIPSVGIFSSIHCSCLLMDTRFSETFHIRLLEHVFPGWIPSAKQSTSIENNHSFFITGFQIIFRPPLQRSQAFFFSPASCTPFSGPPILGHCWVRTLWSSVPTTRNQNRRVSSSAIVQWPAFLPDHPTFFFLEFHLLHMTMPRSARHAPFPFCWLRISARHAQ